MADEIIQTFAVGEASMATAKPTKIKVCSRGSFKRKPYSEDRKVNHAFRCIETSTKLTEREED
jgi:hypothetical protein